MPEWSGYRGSWLAFGGRQHSSLSLRQAGYALKLQHKAKRHSHVNRFNFAKRRGVELLFDMLPCRSLPVTVGQTTLHKLADIGERGQGSDIRDL
jgi:hypothetical protein